MLKSILAGAALTLALAIPAGAKPFAEMFPQYVNDFDDDLLALVEPLDFVQGDVTIGDGLANLSVPEGFYFLDAEDAQYVLQELWGNPPAPEVMGMVFPADATPLHGDTWGLEIFFDEIGYVSDEDAATYDYASVLTAMREDTAAANDWRVENGYPQIQLIGWAEPPKYEASERSLYWAKELSFEGDDENTLNYNIRVLGRRGVLVQNFIAPMSALPEVQAAVPTILAMTEFNPGHTYAEFDPSVDTVAAVGIGGLIAGKVLAKTGFLAIAMVFLKKAWILLLLPLFWVKNLLTRNRSA